MIDYKDDGTIAVTIDGASYTLRKANLPEMIALWQKLDDLFRSARVDQNSIRAEVAATADDGDLPGSPGRTVIAIQVGQWEQTARWFEEAFAMLSSTPLPDGPRPAWFASQSLPRAFVTHWHDTVA